MTSLPVWLGVIVVCCCLIVGVALYLGVVPERIRVQHVLQGREGIDAFVDAYRSAGM